MQPSGPNSPTSKNGGAELRHLNDLHILSPLVREAADDKIHKFELETKRHSKELRRLPAEKSSHLCFAS